MSKLLLHDPLRLVLVLGGDHLRKPLFHVRKSARARREVSNPVVGGSGTRDGQHIVQRNLRQQSFEAQT